MSAIRSQHLRLLDDLVRARRQELLESLATGHGLETYWILVGQVRGMEETLTLSAQADFKLNGGDENDAGA